MAFVVIDNRRSSVFSFEMDSSFTCFNLLSIRTIRQYLTISLKTPIYELHSVLIPQAPDRSRIIPKASLSLPNISETLTTRLSTTAVSSNIPLQTWSGYFVDSIMKITGLLQGGKSTKPNRNNLVVIFSNDINIFGPDSSGTREAFFSGVDNFNSILQKYKDFDLHIRIICTNISNLPGYNNGITVHRTSEEYLQKLRILPNTSFRMIDNTPLHFEAELRSWITASIPPLHANILFPASRGRKASIALDFLPATISTISGIHPGLSSPEIICTLPRNAIDPLLIEAGGFVSLLVSDSLLLLRVIWETDCQQHWILIPPASPLSPPTDRLGIISSQREISPMALLRLTDREGLLEDHRDRDRDRDRDSSLHASLLDESQAVEDSQAVSEMQEFIGEVLASIGKETRYNPLAHPSGSLDKQISMTSSHSPSPLPSPMMSTSTSTSSSTSSSILPNRAQMQGVSQSFRQRKKSPYQFQSMDIPNPGFNLSEQRGKPHQQQQQKQQQGDEMSVYSHMSGGPVSGTKRSVEGHRDRENSSPRWRPVEIASTSKPMSMPMSTPNWNRDQESSNTGPAPGIGTEEGNKRTMAYRSSAKTMTMTLGKDNAQKISRRGNSMSNGNSNNNSSSNSNISVFLEDTGIEDDDIEDFTL
eukprot:gene1182-2301_t